jgi:hypothetical protein
MGADERKLDAAQGIRFIWPSVIACEQSDASENGRRQI